MLSLALAGLRARGPRTWLSALGILAASLVVGTGVTVGYDLATGFERSADRAGLPDVIARFSPERRSTVEARVRALPNLAAASYRYEVLNAPLTANGHHNHQGAVNTIGAGRRGYEILEGRDLDAARSGEAVVGGSRRSGTCTPATASASAASLATCGSPGSPTRPTTSPSRSPPPPASTSRTRRSATGSDSPPTTPTSRCCGCATRRRPT